MDEYDTCPLCDQNKHVDEELCLDCQHDEWWEDQCEAEIYAENAWLRAAEYDPRMDDPREW